ncbi:hypothetical protein Psi02_43470 [Planotetraspora silvatica]|uniref:Uncharacterized protein n=1 Tax=Planotetraspora silvatica TaxID=234614 RepID=A0A8J3ULA0_9ACTN|nr:hypothetical protein [Planotetraspora silvatica]GII47923.1 hypothetical protein Psi02_43470 [Planotetraspora silvatica]
MRNRPSGVVAIWEEATREFAFLTENYDFLGPELTDDGVAYHRPDLHIGVTCTWYKGEWDFTTYLWPAHDPTRLRRGVSLATLYVREGYGPAQAVPESGTPPTRHLMVKRVRQHAAALRAVMPRLHEVDEFAPQA